MEEKGNHGRNWAGERADGDLIGDLGKQRGEVYIAQHSERSVRLDQSAQSSGIRIGIQKAFFFGMKKCAPNSQPIFVCVCSKHPLHVVLPSDQLDLAHASHSAIQPAVQSTQTLPLVWFLHSLAFPSLPFLRSRSSIHPPSVLILSSPRTPHPTPNLCRGD